MNRTQNTAVLLGTLAGFLWGACERNDLTSPCGDDWKPVQYPQRNRERVSIPQGVWGDVWFWQGNFMPFCPTGKVNGVGREIRIHELTSLDDVEEEGMFPFYTKINTPLVSAVWSDADGFFQSYLPTGRYSIFAVEDTLFYANRMDGAGHIFPVEVKADSVTGVRFDINYRAAY